MCGHTYDSKPLPIELASDAFEKKPQQDVRQFILNADFLK